MQSTVLNMRRGTSADVARDTLRWMKHDCLPFWASAGVNARTGLFYERMNADGSPDLMAPLRMRVQFRQIYAFSHAAVLGWLPEGASIALSAWRHLLRLAYEGGGKPGFAHLLSPEGQIVDARRDSYDHAFAVLAAAWLLRATGEPSVRRVLQDLLDFVDRHLTDSHGALHDRHCKELANGQNPQMHWFEAMMALVETGVDSSGEERARRHRCFAEAKLFDPLTGMLGEYYSGDWQPLAGELGQLVEPGHFFEWAWLLRRHDQLTGSKADELPEKLMQAGLDFRCRRTGLLVDQAMRNGTIRRGSRRIWLQTELLKAHLAKHEAGCDGAREEALACLATLDRHYLRKPFASGWIDQLDEQARPLAAPVPAGILYHVFVALSEVERVITRPGSSVPLERPAEVLLPAG